MKPGITRIDARIGLPSALTSPDRQAERMAMPPKAAWSGSSRPSHSYVPAAMARSGSSGRLARLLIGAMSAPEKVAQGERLRQAPSAPRFQRGDGGGLPGHAGRRSFLAPFRHCACCFTAARMRSKQART